MYIGQIAEQSYDLYSQFVLVLFSPLMHSFAPPYAVFCIVIVMCSHFHHFSGGNCVAIVCIFFFFSLFLNFMCTVHLLLMLLGNFSQVCIVTWPLLLIYDIPFVM